MSTEANHIPRLPNAQLREAVFSMQWSLPQLSDTARVRHDPEFEPIAASLTRHYRQELPDVERLVPAGLGHIGLSYQPIVRYLPEGEGLRYPHLQLGPGVFTVNEDGKTYNFEEFKELVATHINAYRKVVTSENSITIKPIRFGFALLNHFDLRDWDDWLQRGGTTVEKPTKASEFLAEVLGFRVVTPYDRLARTSIYRQEYSRTIYLEDGTGHLLLTARDASQSPDHQIVTFDQVVTTKDAGKPLEFSTEGVLSWLESAHSYTKQVFLNLRSQSVDLDNYLQYTS